MLKPNLKPTRSVRRPWLAIALLALTFFYCKKKDTPKTPEEPAAVFDKQAMLTNLADNVVLPCYKEFKLSLDSLETSFNNFKTSLSLTDYQRAKQQLRFACLKFQRVNLFGFGPGEDQAIRSNFNIFPTDTGKIKQNIASGTYNLATAANASAKGFPALDYLFYGHNTSESAQWQWLAASAGRRQYAGDLIKDMSVKINAAIDAWNNGYRTTFINSLGTDVGSPIGFVVNQINYELDYLKNAKFATPLGLRSDGTPRPDHSEAFYENKSMPYAIETLNIIENIYRGKSFSGNDGKGFDDYLTHLGATNAGGSLASAISNQFSAARTKLNAIADPLSEKVVSNPATVNDAYKELVKLLVLLKTDMPSSLGVAITYQDGDGD